MKVEISYSSKYKVRIIISFISTMIIELGEKNKQNAQFLGHLYTEKKRNLTQYPYL